VDDTKYRPFAGEVAGDSAGQWCSLAVAISSPLPLDRSRIWEAAAVAISLRECMCRNPQTIEGIVCPWPHSPRSGGLGDAIGSAMPSSRVAITASRSRVGAWRPTIPPPAGIRAAAQVGKAIVKPATAVGKRRS
jgi:hypothetical protein